MKRLLACVTLCALPVFRDHRAAGSAQLAVYDPANHVQNVYQAVRALQQVDQQTQQLTHEIAMLENMARDLGNPAGTSSRATSSAACNVSTT